MCVCVYTLQKKESAPLDKQVKKYIEGRFEVSAPKRSSRVVFTRKDAKDAKVCAYVCVCACVYVPGGDGGESLPASRKHPSQMLLVALEASCGGL